MKGTIIGLAGKKRSGKDTVADYLVEEYGFVRVAFADPIKELMLELDPIIEEPLGWTRLSELVDPDASKSIRDRFEPIKDIPEVRRLLQRHGVAVRKISEDFWVDAAMDKITAIWDSRLGDVPGFVIADVRFPNEVEAVRDNSFGYVLEVVREGLLSDDTHISETALTGYDFEGSIDNGGSILDLHREVDRALEVLAAEHCLDHFNKIRENA